MSVDLLFQFDAGTSCGHACSCGSRYVASLHSLSSILSACFLGASAAALFTLPPAPVDDESPPPPPHAACTTVDELELWWIASLRDLRVRPALFVARVLQACSDAPPSSLGLLMCDESPVDLADVLRRDWRLVRRFFVDDARRTDAFFDQFAFNTAGRGSAALAAFLIEQRDRLWSSIAWRGGRGVPPWTAVQRPESWLQLDVQDAIRRLLRDDELWWSSAPLRDALLSADWIRVDRAALADEFNCMLRDGARRDIAIDAVRALLLRLEPAAVLERIARDLSPQQKCALLFNVAPVADQESGSVPRYAARFRASIVSETQWQSYDAMLLHGALTSRLRVLVNSVLADSHAHWHSVLRAWSDRRRADVPRSVLCCGFAQLRAQAQGSAALRASLLTLEGVALLLDAAALNVDCVQAFPKRKRKRGDDDGVTVLDGAASFEFGASEVGEQMVLQWQWRQT
jgi:hypothetical protein